MRVKKVEVYVITDKRVNEIDCGHHSSKEYAYSDLAATLIYKKEQEKDTFIDPNDEEQLERVIRLESRLARYLQYLDSKEDRESQYALFREEKSLWQGW
jgi:hypothetical protein